MLRAMDAAVAGLRAHQGKMDVLSNNIANVNTFGFKAQSYSFKDTLYHTTNASASGTQKTVNNGNNNGNVAVTGGKNAAQYGYGSLTGSIATDFTSSTPSYIGGFNASINGPGFFITSPQNDVSGIQVDINSSNEGVTKTTTTMKATNFYYTRVGQFNVDSNGMIVDSNGNFVYGFRPDYYTDAETYGKTVNENSGGNNAGGNNSGGNNSGGNNSGDGDSGTSADYRNLVPLRAPSAGKTVITVEKDDSTGDISYTRKATSDADFATLPSMPIKSIEIGNDGVIKAIVEQKVKTSGAEDEITKEISIVIGKVAIASFQNQEGLMKAGNNTFTTAASDNTGNVTATEPGVGATPTLMAGYLENSNVDLAKEFTDMITSQRGFQANSKVITVSDEILQELVNMKR
ncbi:flagellar hook-basal body complex protein [Oribacterium sp. NK2B42]|uniref:flagellar hook-basal body complex protein n=1 Tax=Oribacterium sp. NK2B42 TaxID=689781 RepID=UPI000408E4C5|nr:flagellar hook-basal body complex protein [Oribacterium sp. NK2B42]